MVVNIEELQGALEPGAQGRHWCMGPGYTTGEKEDR